MNAEPTVMVTLDWYSQAARAMAEMAALEAVGLLDWEGYGEVDWDEVQRDVTVEISLAAREAHNG